MPVAAARMAVMLELQGARDNASVFDLMLFCSVFIRDDFRIYMSDETGFSMSDSTHIRVSVGCCYLVTST